MEHHLRPLLVITILALLLAGTGYMLWPQKSSAPVQVGNQIQNVSTLSPGADPATSTPLNRPDLFDGAQDKNHIFVQGQVVEKTTPDGTVLKPLGFNNLYSDGQRILQGSKVISSDAAHFSRVQIPQSRFLCAEDSTQFYLCSSQSSQIDPIDGSDPASFVVLKDSDGQDSLYGKDRNLVYWFGEPDGLPAPNVTVVTGADSASFSAVSANPIYDARDKNHKYLQGQVVQ